MLYTLHLSLNPKVQLLSHSFRASCERHKPESFHRADAEESAWSKLCGCHLHRQGACAQAVGLSADTAVG